MVTKRQMFYNCDKTAHYMIPLRVGNYYFVVHNTLAIFYMIWYSIPFFNFFPSNICVLTFN